MTAPVVAGIRISHGDRVVYPEAGITKLAVARYYNQVGKWMVPHVTGRPLTLVHCPEGLNAECRFMKHSKLWGPEVIRRVRIQEKKKIGEYMIADSIQSLVGLAQMGILEIHTWNSTDRNIEKPNRIVIDLDPGENIKWPQVVEATSLVRRLLQSLGLASFPKTTGGRGMHVVVPLVPRADWQECLDFAHALSDIVERSNPELYTTQFAKAGRESKILLDYLRNNRTNTSIAAYSTRARSGATVSVPITWRELKPSLDPASFTIETVPVRVKRLRHDPWKDYWTTRQALTKSMMKAVRGLLAEDLS